MDFFRPDNWQEALEIKAAYPGARPIAGGTDMMVELNFDHDRPEAVVDLTRIPELTGVGARERPPAHRGRGDVYANNRGAGRQAARPRDGLEDRRVAPDPQPGHRRR